MKYLRFLLFLLFITTQLYGQAPVTNSSWLPSAGDKFYLYRIPYSQTTTPISNSGDTGANITWNFNDKKFQLNRPDDSITFTTPSAINVTPINSQVNLVTGDSSGYAFYIKNSSGLTFTESYAKSINNPEYPIYHTVLTNPAFIFKNNLSFRDSYTDTVNSYTHSQYNHLDSPSRCKELSFYKYDGYGTLQAGNMTFNNVVRILEQREEWDSTYNSNYKFYAFSKIYTWYDNTNKNGLLTYVDGYSVDKSTQDTSHYNGLTLQLPATYFTSIPNPPNPPQNIQAYINGNIIYVSGKISENVIYSIYDLQGKKLNSGKLTLFGAQEHSKINVQNLRPGSYLLQVKNESGVERSIKLIKNQ